MPLCAHILWCSILRPLFLVLSQWISYIHPIHLIYIRSKRKHLPNGKMKDTPKGRGRRSVDTLTDAQRRVLREIRDFISHRGFPPTGQELADLLGVSSATAHEQVGQLVRKGFVRREPRKARGLLVVREPDDEPAG